MQQRTSCQEDKTWNKYRISRSSYSSGPAFATGLIIAIINVNKYSKTKLKGAFTENIHNKWTCMQMILVKVEVKFTLGQAMKAQRGNRCITVLFL